MAEDRRTAVWLAVALVVLAALGPALVTARPAFEIPVYDSTGDGDALANASGARWGRAPPVTVPLSPAPSGVPAADDTTVDRVSVQAATADGRIYLRLSWPDATRDTAADGPRTFADAVAVQVPVNTTARPPIAMGSTRNLVNVWYWNGATGTEELLAGGAGTTTQFGNPAVTVDRSYEDGRWTVVFARNLTAASTNRTDVTLERDVDVAVAVWNGSNMERSGRKSVSEWYYLALGPGPQGPPYEAILWTVAGAAVVFVALVTIRGVRRAASQDASDGEPESGGEP